MELRHLRYFMAVAEALNFSRAAAKLRVAQPALSRQIRDLEEELGAVLLERGPRGARLTPAGQVFAGEARAVLEQARLAVERTRAVAQAGHGEIHVGYAPTPTVELLPRALHAFQNASPQVKVSLHDLSNEEMRRGLRDRKLDLVLTVRSDLPAGREVAFEELIRYPMRLAVSPRHPLARGRRPVALAALGGERFHVYAQTEYPEYHRLLRRLLKAAGQVLQVAGEHDSATSLIAAVEAGQGVALTPSCMSCLAGPRLRLLELDPAPEPLSVGVAYAKEVPLKPAATRFLATLRELKK